MEENETVDHIDGNIDNNEIENLQILERSTHVKLDKIRKCSNVKCVYCNEPFILESGKLRNRRSSEKKGKSGPFCSKVCAGKYGTDIQNNRCDKKESIRLDEHKFKLKKPLKTLDK